MSEVTISHFAAHIGVSIDKLLEQLGQAGIAGKSANDILEDSEKVRLLQFLKGAKTEKAKEVPGRTRITLKRKTTNEIRQTSRTGAARTVHVETRKKRTFIKRSDLEAEQAEELKRRSEEEKQRQKDMEMERRRQEEERLAKETLEREAALEAEREQQAREQIEQAERAAQEVERAKQMLQEQEDEQPAEIEGSPQQETLMTDVAKADITETEVAKVDVSETDTAEEKVKAGPEPPPEMEMGHDLSTPSDSPEIGKKTDTVHRPEKRAKSGKAPDSNRAKPVHEREETTDSRSKKGRKARASGAEREELHASKRRKDRRRPVGRKPGKISSSVADQHGFTKPTATVVHTVRVPETITVGELAQAMSVKAAEVIKVMMSMGSMVTINQVLDQDTALLLVDEMGHKGIPASMEDPEDMLSQHETGDTELLPRAPVVTVMGHVDHGKTSLLDYLRQTKVVSGEAGGITQHLGAYKVKLNGHEICFLDTPGHEAFSAMRARGANVTDVVVLVVAADDGVKPQTVEAIRHAQAAKVPIVVAINKVDLEGADPERVKQELVNYEVIPEELGGDTLMNNVSALTGEGVSGLLNSVLLQAEMADLNARANGTATGIVVEARLDKGRGPVATVLVQEGMLHKGDVVLAGRETGRVRVLLDDMGIPVSQAAPSTPVEIHGLGGVPIAGDDMVVVADERKAREVALHRQGRFKEVKLAQQQKSKLEGIFKGMEEGEILTLNIVIKADVHGSVEALREALTKLSTETVSVNVVHAMVGGINESDVNLAITSGAIILAFNVRADSAARKLIESEQVTVHYHNVIYDVVDLVKNAMSGLLSPIQQEEYVGLAEVRDIFRAPKIGVIAGSYVLEGAVRRHLPVRVLRDNVVVFEGAIDSLRRFKDDVQEVTNGYECGIGIRNYNDVKVGDQIEVFKLVEKAQAL